MRAHVLRVVGLAAGFLACGCASQAKQPAATCGCALKNATSARSADESAVMAKIRADVKADPASALSEADRAGQRFGESSFAEERGALAIQALINLGQIGAARSRAYPFLDRYPNGPYAANVAAMTGIHVTPVGPGASNPAPKAIPEPIP